MADTLTTAAGEMSQAEELFRATLAGSAAFQTATGAANAAGALPRIHTDALPRPANRAAYTLAELSKLRPYAVVWTAEADGFTWTQLAHGSAGGSEFASTGTIGFQLVAEVDPAVIDWPAEAARRFKNLAGTIGGQLLDLAGTAGYLGIWQVALTNGPHRSEPDERPAIGDCYWADLVARWR